MLGCGQRICVENSNNQWLAGSVRYRGVDGAHLGRSGDMVMVMRIQTSLAKAKGLGSAKDGAHHWWMQRVSAVALIFLTAWIVCLLSSAFTHGGHGVVPLLRKPFYALVCCCLSARRCITEHSAYAL